jgi:hypothetical protein
MASKFRAASTFWNGKRMSYATNGEWTPSTSGGEDVITEDGFQDVTDGAEINEVSIDYAIPYLGTGIVLKVHDRGTLTVAAPNTQVITMPNCVVMEAPVTWDHVKGTMTGKYRFRCGKATRTG